ncbi:PIN domain-containing protein [Marinilabilia salmonicolor]|jgi:predicted nucleic-acid-binding protein|uniref:Putative nucleic-acid-binding protein n=1 Tax=Marinilabilia salmonicolor TaxID=989 RepID=A0A368UNQ4_9BACT|nr:PIN domain-containing protein [Marinilabilia salmonicolor]RCW30427.1 putative nucleic-acid-binding protein [Marinilabilia salmonicolor]
MKIIDANYILRYLLKDIDEQYLKSASVIENYNVFLPGEIIAEVVYVLQKVYQVPDEIIKSTLLDLFEYPTISINEPKIIKKALSIFAGNRVDYADALLIAFVKEKMLPYLHSIKR